MSGSFSNARVDRGGPQQIEIFTWLGLRHVPQRPPGGFGIGLAKFAQTGQVGHVGADGFDRFNRAELQFGGFWSGHRALADKGPRG